MRNLSAILCLFAALAFAFSGCGSSSSDSGSGWNSSGSGGDPIDTVEVTGAKPTNVTCGTEITITGRGFGATRSPRENDWSNVSFLGRGGGSTNSEVYNLWTDNEIRCIVPDLEEGQSYTIVVTNITSSQSSTSSSTSSSSNTLSVITPSTRPAIIDITPTLVNPQQAITITGMNFGAAQGTSYVAFSYGRGTIIQTTANSWNDTEVVCNCPPGIPRGAVFVYLHTDVGGNSTPFQIASFGEEGSGWGTEEAISSNSSNASYPEIAMDPDGNAIAVWLQMFNGQASIYANRYVPGTGWEQATLLETDDVNPASRVQVAMDPDGNAIAVWTQDFNGRDSVYANRYVPGTGWEGATLLETDDVNLAQVPHVAMDPDGNAIAVWTQAFNGRISIYANRYVPGGVWPAGWGGRALIETDDTNPAYSPQVAMDSNGSAIVAWLQSFNGENSIYANHYVPGGVWPAGWASRALLETDDTNPASPPKIAMNPAGRAIVVWAQEFLLHPGVYANSYTPGGVWPAGWGGRGLIEKDDPYSATIPYIAMDPGGNAIAVWSVMASTQNIYARRFIAGTGWDPFGEIPLESGTGEGKEPRIAMDADGNGIAVWYQYDGLQNSIYARRFIAGTGWDPLGEIPLEFGTGDAGDPRIAIDADGNGIAVWHQKMGSYYRITANRYEP